MGLIREPAEIDFTLISKTWTAEEEKEFSELIKNHKNKQQRQTTSIFNTKKRKYFVPEMA